MNPGTTDRHEPSDIDPIDSSGFPTEYFRFDPSRSSSEATPIQIGSIEQTISGSLPKLEQNPNQQSESFDPTDLRSRLSRSFDRMRELIIGADPVLRQNTLALLTGKHQLVTGPTGEAKTFLLRQLAEIFDRTNIFRITLTGTDREDALVGGIVMERWLKGERGVRNTTDSIIECDIALINEFRDAHPRTLRVLNDVLNERELRLAGRPYRVKLHSAIACTEVNGDPPENLRAVLDRFQLKAHLAGKTSVDDQLAIDLAYVKHHGQPVPIPKRDQIPIDWLRQASTYIWQETALPNHVLFAKDLLFNRWREGEEQLPGHFLSKRAATGSIDILKASAFLANRNVVTLEDIQTLQYTIPVVGTPNQHEFAALAREAATLFDKSECAKIDRLIDIRQAVSELEQGVRDGKRYEASFLEKVMTLLHLTSTGRLTFRGLRDAVVKIDSEQTAIRDLRKSTLAVIEHAQKRIDYQDEQNLFLGA